MTLQNTCIWVVDDDEDDQFFLRQIFNRLEPPVNSVAVEDGAELLGQLDRATQPPQLILLDLNMPRQNGFDTLAELRRSVSHRQIPVVVLTTSSEASDRERAMKLGANEFLTKPATYEQLGKLVGDLLSTWTPTHTGA